MADRVDDLRDEVRAAMEARGRHPNVTWEVGSFMAWAPAIHDLFEEVRSLREERDAYRDVVEAARTVRSQSYDGDAMPTLKRRLKALDDALDALPAPSPEGRQGGAT